MIYASAGSTFEAVVDGFPTGLVGTLGVRILDTPGGAVVLARTTAGIAEAPAGSGLYGVSLTAPVAVGSYSQRRPNHRPGSGSRADDPRREQSNTRLRDQLHLRRWSVLPRRLLPGQAGQQHP